jgi:thiol-disulfide isomerase/thioredoxin
LASLSARSLIVLLPLFIALEITGCDKPKQTTEQASATSATPNSHTPVAPVPDRVDRSHKGAAMPTMPFAAPGGAPATLGGFRGHPVLVNLWATWCGPCVQELPALDRLAAGETGRMAVVAISQDMGGDTQVQPFWKARGLKALTPYTDGKNALMTAIGATELPTTILYDAKGHEVWRTTGGLDWTGPDATRLLAEAS